LLGVQEVSQSFSQRGWFTKEGGDRVALRNVTASFRDVTSIVGHSGSGKSTLAKLILKYSQVGQERALVEGGRFILQSQEGVAEEYSSGFACAYVDALFYLCYDANASVGALLKAPTAASSSDGEAANICIEAMQRDLGILSLEFEREKPSNLLESQRMCFEMLLATKSSFSGVSMSRKKRPLLILDEYLDKCHPSVTRKIFDVLRLWCRNDLVQLQVVVVTHSSHVMQSADWSVVLNKGLVFDQGVPSKVTKPVQLLMLK